MKHSIFLVILTLILTYNQTSGQSFIYNSKGQVIVDTTLTINQDQLEIWRLVENNIHTHISKNIDYSNIARDAEIKGIAIAAFDCDSMDIKNIRLIKNLGGGLDENIIEGIEKISEKIIHEFQLNQNIRNGENLNYQGTYYIPFDFSLIDLNEIMMEKNAIPIIDFNTPLIWR